MRATRLTSAKIFRHNLLRCRVEIQWEHHTATVAQTDAPVGVFVHKWFDPAPNSPVGAPKKITRYTHCGKTRQRTPSALLMPSAAIKVSNQIHRCEEMGFNIIQNVVFVIFMNRTVGAIGNSPVWWFQYCPNVIILLVLLDCELHVLAEVVHRQAAVSLQGWDQSGS